MKVDYCLLVMVGLIFILGGSSVAEQIETMPLAGEEVMFEKVAEGFSFPEGPAWDGKGALYVSNCRGGWIACIRQGESQVFLKSSTEPFTFNSTNGLVVHQDGSLFACDFGAGAILRIDQEGVSEIYASGYRGSRFQRPNDLAFDPQGNLYFTDSGAYRKENPDGVVYRIDARTREVTPAAEGLGFPNGLAFAPDAKHLYVCESAFQRIVRFRVLDDGKLETAGVFAELPGGDPDGINFDREGNLYVAHFGGGAVFVLSPEGDIKKKIPAPGKQPSNVEFGGDDLRTLFLTECETNAVYRLRVETPGLPLFCSPVAMD